MSIERFVSRHIHPGIPEQIDRVLRHSRTQECQITIARSLIAGKDLLRERLRGRERGGVLEDVEPDVEVRNIAPLMLDVIVDHAHIVGVAVVTAGDVEIETAERLTGNRLAALGNLVHADLEFRKLRLTEHRRLDVLQKAAEE